MPAATQAMLPLAFAVTLCGACGGSVDDLGTTTPEVPGESSVADWSRTVPTRDAVFAAPPRWAGDAFATLRLCPNAGYEISTKSPRAGGACAASGPDTDLVATGSGDLLLRSEGEPRVFHRVTAGAEIRGSYLIHAWMGTAGEESIYLTRHAVFEQGAFFLVVAMEKASGSAMPTPYASTVHGTYVSLGPGLVEMARRDQVAPRRVAWFEMATPATSFAYIEGIGWFERVRT